MANITINVPLADKPNEGIRKDSGASLANLIAQGAVTITDKITGEPVNLNDPAVIAGYAQRAGNMVA